MVFKAVATYISVFLILTHFSCVHYKPFASLAQDRKKKETAIHINSLIDGTDPNLNVGIKIFNLNTGDVLYEKNNQNRYTPASNVKLFTAAAALYYLGPYFRYNTALFTDAEIETSPANNLYIKASGNPDFTDYGLEKLSTDLNFHDISEVSGNIIIDNSEFDLVYQGPGWAWDEGAGWYSAQVDAMTLNDNCVQVIVKPGKTLNAPPAYFLNPSTEFVSINNSSITTTIEDSLNPLNVERRWKTSENIIDVSGTMEIKSPLRTFTIGVDNPALYTGVRFKELLSHHSITFSGDVLIDTIPNGAVKLTEVESEPLYLSLINFLKNSDNLTGELLVKKMGAVTDTLPGSWRNGMRAVKTFIHDEVGIDTSSLVLVDGSGLSRYNLLSPAQIVDLLIHVYNDFKIFPEFLSSMAIGGADGSLQKRMFTEKLHLKTRAKTGSLNGVSSLSGYTVTSDNDIVAFSIMMNGFVGNHTAYRELQDNILSAITQYSSH